MKKTLHLIIILLAFNYVNAQEFQCDFVPEQWMLKQSNYSNRFQTIPDDGRRFIFNVKFHGFLNLNGDNPYNIGEERFLRTIAKLNIYYNQFNIFFKYRGFNIIKKDEYYAINQFGGFPQHADLKAYLKLPEVNLYEENMINVYIVKNGGRSITGDSDIGIKPNQTDEAYYDYETPHEMGHMLGLLHPHSINGQLLYTFLPQCIANSTSPFMAYPPFYPYDEHVTRDITSPHYNADHTGDWVHDTGACFGGFDSNFDRPSSGCNPEHYNEDPRVADYTGGTNTTCYYDFSTNTKYSYTTGASTYVATTNGISTSLAYTTTAWQNISTNYTSIPNGETYKNLENIKHNIMYRNILPATFTPGQGQRMRETILGNNPNLSPSQNHLYQKLNLDDDNLPDISVLYEPFAFGATGNSNPPIGTAYARTISPNETNTGVNVWNCGPFIARFQTGFNYEFSNPSGQIVTQTPLQQFNATCNGYIGVKIPILGNDIFQTMEPMCFSSFEPYVKGEVKSLDNLGSFYFTIEELDAIKATNPNLYEELQSGKYHIIIKETESGYIDQKVIYKN